MIKRNELVIDGIGTSSFPFKVIVHESPSVILAESKTSLLEHKGMSWGSFANKSAPRFD